MWDHGLFGTGKGSLSAGGCFTIPGSQTIRDGKVKVGKIQGPAHLPRVKLFGLPDIFYLLTVGEFDKRM